MVNNIRYIEWYVRENSCILNEIWDEYGPEADIQDVQDFCYNLFEFYICKLVEVKPRTVDSCGIYTTKLNEHVISDVINVVDYDLAELKHNPFNYCELMQCSMEYLYQTSNDTVKEILTPAIRIQALEDEAEELKQKLNWVNETIKEISNGNF